MDGVAVEPDPTDSSQPGVIHRLLEGYRHDFRTERACTAEADRLAVDRWRKRVEFERRRESRSAAADWEASLLVQSAWPEFTRSRDGATFRLDHDLVSYEVSVDPIIDQAQIDWLATYLRDAAHRDALESEDPGLLLDAACLAAVIDDGYVPREMVRTMRGPRGDRRTESSLVLEPMSPSGRMWVTRAMQREDQFLASIGPRDVAPHPSAPELVGPLVD